MKVWLLAAIVVATSITAWSQEGDGSSMEPMADSAGPADSAAALSEIVSSDRLPRYPLPFHRGKDR